MASETEKETQREEGHMKTEAEGRVTLYSQGMTRIVGTIRS